MKHFEVYLKDGTILDFDKKCEYMQVLDDSGKLLELCTKKSKEGSVLAVIPIESILYILSVED